MPTFETTKKGYGHLWDDCRVRPEHEVQAKNLVAKGLANQGRYQTIQKNTGVPWWVVWPIHQRESDMNFMTHLHNGDSLRGYTHHVPAGRPKVGHGPPFTFEESASDALTLEGITKVSHWSVERALFEWEKYNGTGYIRYGENSPYVWGWTTEQQAGKFTSDGHFDPGSWDTQPGCAVMLKELLAKDPTLKLPRESDPPSEVIKDQTTRERNARNGGAVVTTGSAGTKVATDHPEKTFTHSVLEWTAIGIGVALFIVGAILVQKRVAFIKQKWSGGK